MKVQISAIQVPPSYRFDPGNREELKITLQHFGMIHPIVVRELPPESGFKYELIAGYRRLQAAIALGWSEVPITVLTPKDTLEQFDVSMDEDLKKKVESGEMHFRKALSEQSARKMVATTKSKPKSLGVNGVPEPPVDVLKLQYDVQRVVWQFAGLYQAFRLMDGKEYTLVPLNEERLVQLAGMGSSLRDWVSKFNIKVQDALLEKTGITVSKS